MIFDGFLDGEWTAPTVVGEMADCRRGTFVEGELMSPSKPFESLFVSISLAANACFLLKSSRVIQSNTPSLTSPVFCNATGQSFQRTSFHQRP